MKGGFHDELAKELQVTSVSSLGSSSASQYISSLDKNGDGIISADELAAANTTSTATAKSSTATTTADDSTSVTKKIAADIVSLMLQLQQQSSSSDSDDGSTDGNSPKGILALMDSNGDGKLTTSEVLSADPAAIAQGAGSGDDSVLTQVLNDMQTAMRAYQTTYGASPAADTGSDETLTA
jgi:Ca2+-binding EF-hand superfamily protein